MTAAPRPRILLVTRNLPPLVGGMERLNWHLAEQLSRVAAVRVVGPAGSGAAAPAGVEVREAPLKPLWKFLLAARALARREARAWQPDWVLAGSGLTAPLARSAARACGARTAVYVHGLDVAVQHPVYRAVWMPALRRMDRVIANSRATAALCRNVGIDPTRIGIVHPGVDVRAEPSPGTSRSKKIRRFTSLSPWERDGGEGTEPRAAALRQARDADRGASLEPLSPRERGRGEGTEPRAAALRKARDAGRQAGLEPLSPREKGSGEGADPHAGASGREKGGGEGAESLGSADLEPLSRRERGEGAESLGGADLEPLSLRERGRGEGSETRGDADSEHHVAYEGPEPSPGVVRNRKGRRFTPPLPTGEGSCKFRRLHHLADGPLLLSVGRLSARKGLREFVARALPAIVAKHPGVVLLIVGDAPKDALHARAQTPDRIRVAAAEAGIAGNLRFLGSITDYGELGVVYRAADVHVFPVREIPGDPEGFGMVAIEAAAHGLPTVAFATGGVPDAVIEGETGSLIPPGDYAAFAASVNAWLARHDRDKVAARCVGAAEPFSWRHFGETLCAVLDLGQPR